MIDLAEVKTRVAEWRGRLDAQLVPPDIDELLERMPKPVGSFGYDPWGYKVDSARYILSIGRWLFRHYFRVQVRGLDNVPPEGRVLLVGNHGGQLPVDGLLTAIAVATNPDGPRACRPMIERFFPTVPWLAPMLSSWGAVIGDPLNCSRMLERDEAVLVFPEGVRGSGKLFKDRYQLKRFGTGFMHIAMRTQSPIIPVGIVGCEEAMPSIANISPLAKMLGLPYFPLTPTYVPLPTRVIIHFGRPMHFGARVESEEQVVKRVELVKNRIRVLIQRGLSEREGIFR